MSNALMSQTIVQLAGADDPKQALIDKVSGVIDGVTLLGEQLLLATYIRSNRTKGGIYLTEKAMEEDRFQGKVGLLLKCGPTAFKYDETGQYAFEGEPPALHSWLVYRASEGWEIGLNGVSCRIISARYIRMIVDNPTVIW